MHKLCSVKDQIPIWHLRLVLVWDLQTDLPPGLAVFSAVFTLPMSTYVPDQPLRACFLLLLLLGIADLFAGKDLSMSLGA